MRTGARSDEQHAIDRFPRSAIAETLAGVPGIVDLWYWQYEPLTERVLAESCEPLMSAEESDRWRALRFDRDRRLFLATRLLVRTVLSRYAAIRPEEWRFSADPSGKPHVAHPASCPLHFNLANTPGLVTCAVSVAHASIGVDAERLDRTVDFLGLAARYFSRSEAEALEALSPREVPKRFFMYWTLKESYVKARGLGLALPLDRFSFSIERDVVRATFDGTNDHETGWHFASIDVPPNHLIAVGANTGTSPLSLRASRVDPLAAGTRA